MPREPGDGDVAGAGCPGAHCRCVPATVHAAGPAGVPGQTGGGAAGGTAHAQPPTDIYAGQVSGY